jgi:hypothetical protein
MMWVPGLEGIVGNDTADQLARTGSEHPFIGAEPAHGISIGGAKKAVRDWMNRNHKKTLGSPNWTQTGIGIYTRALCQNNKKDLSKLNRDQLRLVIVLFTGHCHLKGHLFKLGLTDDPTCERCLEEVESAIHILCDCEAITYLRLHPLGQYFLEPSDYYDTPINRVLHFI